MGESSKLEQLYHLHYPCRIIVADNNNNNDDDDDDDNKKNKNYTFM